MQLLQGTDTSQTNRQKKNENDKMAQAHGLQETHTSSGTILGSTTPVAFSSKKKNYAAARARVTKTLILDNVSYGLKLRCEVTISHLDVK